MMEFGALVCLPRNPACSTCIFARVCIAKIKELTTVLPVKKNRSTPRVRYFNYLFAEHDGRILMKKRNGKDIWHSLWEFPLVETPEAENFSDLCKRSAWGPLINENPVNLNEPVITYQHKLTHQTLICSFYNVNINEMPDECQMEFISVGLQNVSEYAVPSVIDRYLKELLRQR
jgi:A/G-specific adenine glycosylase